MKSPVRSLVPAPSESASFVGLLVHRMINRDVAAHALALAAQQVLCMAPFVVAASALMQRFGLGTVMDLLAELLGLDTLSAHALGSLFRTRFTIDIDTLSIGFLISLGFAVSVAATTQRMLESLWAAPRAPLRALWRQVVWLAALAPVLIGAMMAAHTIRLHRPAGSTSTTLLIALAMGGFAGLFVWWSQRLLLRATISWRRLLPGSALSAIGVTAVCVITSIVAPTELIDETQAYGPIGAGFVMATWLLAMTGTIAGAILIGAVIDDYRFMSRRASTVS